MNQNDYDLLLEKYKELEKKYKRLLFTLRYLEVGIAAIESNLEFLRSKEGQESI